MAPRLNVFCCAAREDQEMLRLLQTHLALLERQGQVTIWSEMRLAAGAEWEEESQRHLNEADLILLLISSDFLASDYCYHSVMERALQRHRDDQIPVIPILLRATHYAGAPFEGLPMLPADQEKPFVTSWPRADDAFLAITARICEVVKDLQARKARALQIQDLLAEAALVARRDGSEEALEVYDRLLRLDPENRQAHLGRLQVLYHRYAWNEEERQLCSTFLKAVADLERLDASILTADVYRQQARTLTQLERDEEAMFAIERALQLEPANEDSFFLRANIFYDLHRYDDALAAIRRAIQLKPRRSDYAYWAAELLYRLRRFEEALAMNPQQTGYDVKPHEQRGRILEQLQRLPEARSAYRYAINIFRQKKGGPLRGTELFDDLGNRSIDSLSLWDLYGRVGSLCIQLEEYEEALATYEEALAVSHKYVRYDDQHTFFAGLGEAFYHLQRYDEAITNFLFAISNSRSRRINPQYYYQLGLAYEKLGQMERAQRVYAREEEQRAKWQPGEGRDVFLVPAPCPRGKDG